MPNPFWSRKRTILDALDSAEDAIGSASVPPALETSSRQSSDAEERVDQLLLVCAAMWELLSEKAGVTENDLIAKIGEIDARDGVADGKMTGAAVQCPKCQRNIFPKQRRCLYCGAERPADTVFKTI